MPQDASDPPPPLDYAKPSREPRRPRFHRRTAIGVFIADAVLMGIGAGLAAADVRSMFLAVPLLILNLPALPLACVFSGMFEGRSDPSPWIGAVRAVTMVTCEATIASLAWGWLVGQLRAGTSRRRDP